MRLSLIICTYQRPDALKALLNSVSKQTRLPDEVLVIDGSNDLKTSSILNSMQFPFPFSYYWVEKEHRGLTKQRNYGLNRVADVTELVSFLDDDLILQEDYFEQVLITFENNEKVIGVGGIDLKENSYFEKEKGRVYNKFKYYELDGWVKKEPLRYKLRKLFGLLSPLQPDIIPDFSHGRSGFPPNGKIYQVEHFMGGIATYKKALFDKIKFSTYFEGYGLYEDFDFCVRALPFGNLVVNTKAQVWHYHEPSGRPNKYKYGKMVVRNGWYVWRLRFPQNSRTAIFKWHATELLLATVRLYNAIAGPSRKEALVEYLGRVAGWFSLWLNPPTIIR